MPAADIIEVGERLAVDYASDESRERGRLQWEIRQMERHLGCVEAAIEVAGKEREQLRAAICDRKLELAGLGGRAS